MSSLPESFVLCVRVSCLKIGYRLMCLLIHVDVPIYLDSTISVFDCDMQSTGKKGHRVTTLAAQCSCTWSASSALIVGLFICRLVRCRDVERATKMGSSWPVGVNSITATMPVQILAVPNSSDKSKLINRSIFDSEEGLFTLRSVYKIVNSFSVTWSSFSLSFQQNMVFHLISIQFVFCLYCYWRSGVEAC